MVPFDCNSYRALQPWYLGKNAPVFGFDRVPAESACSPPFLSTNQRRAASAYSVHAKIFPNIRYSNEFNTVQTLWCYLHNKETKNENIYKFMSILSQLFHFDKQFQILKRFRIATPKAGCEVSHDIVPYVFVRWRYSK